MNGDSRELGDGDELVCLCFQVTEATIRKAIREGADTVAKIRAKTQANTGCEGCLSAIEDLIAQETRYSKAE